MISNIDASNKYKLATEITSTRKTKQVVMLYDGMIKFLHEARDAIERDDIQTRYNRAEKVGKIIDGLHSCLDPEKGKEITEMLDKFYSGIFFRVMNLNFEKDKAKNLKNCDQIITEMKMMRDAWADVDAKVTSGEISCDNTSSSSSPDVKPDGGFEVSI